MSPCGNKQNAVNSKQGVLYVGNLELLVFLSARHMKLSRTFKID